MDNGAMTGNTSEMESTIVSSPFKARKLFLIFTYFSAIPVFVFFLVLFSLSIKYESSGQIARQLHKPQYQALPSDNSASFVAVETHDARIEALDSFFAEYNSPLEGHAQLIVNEADSHNIDYRLLPAIAMQESTLCKKIIKNSFNCWGFGIYGSKVTKFTSYEHAIKVITATMSKKYVRIGLNTPEEIVKKYTPSDTGRWAEVVTLMMQRLKERI